MSSTVSSSTDTSATTSLSTDSTGGGLSVDKETFLTLLVTQLQNQDPLNPLSNQDFVAQLAQFNSLEELMNLNDSMSALYMATASMNNAAMTSLIGRQIVAVGDQFSYSGEGSVELGYEAMADTSQATLTITDEDGTVVWTGEIGALDEGEGTCTWSGTDQYGNAVPEGTYTFAIEATDSNGDPVQVDTLITGIIDAMSYTTGTPVPSINGIDIAIGDILRVESAPTEKAE